MTQQEEYREQFIKQVASIMRTQPFTFEFKVKKHPNGVKIIQEVTKEEFDAIMRKAAERRQKEKEE